MEHLIELLEMIIRHAAELTCCLAEIIGIVMLVVELIRNTVKYIKGDHTAPGRLGHGIAHALTFLLIGEVMHTITGRTFFDLGILGTTILLRAAIIVLIWWEEKHLGGHSKE